MSLIHSWQSAKEKKTYKYKGTLGIGTKTDLKQVCNRRRMGGARVAYRIPAEYAPKVHIGANGRPAHL